MFKIQKARRLHLLADPAVGFYPEGIHGPVGDVTRRLVMLSGTWKAS